MRISILKNDDILSLIPARGYVTLTRLAGMLGDKIPIENAIRASRRRSLQSRSFDPSKIDLATAAAFGRREVIRSRLYRLQMSKRIVIYVNDTDTRITRGSLFCTAVRNRKSTSATK